MILICKNFIQFNPKIQLKKGTNAKKVDMDKLTPFTRKITGYIDADFTGGSKFTNGDTLLARITPCLENGKTAYVDVLEDKEIGFGSTEFIVLRAIEGISAPLFIYYLAVSPDFREIAIASMTGTSGRQRVDVKALKQLEINLPPIEEQRRIAQILGALDDVHAKQKGLPKADIMREYDLTDELYDLFPSNFENSSLGPIPLGWQVKTLGDISTCYDSKRIPLSNRERAERQGNYPYYGATSIMDHVDDFLFDGIYLLLGEDGSVVKPEGTPFLQYVFGKIWVNNHAHVLQGKAPVGTEFLYLFLSDVQIQPYVTGAVQAKLNQKNMNSIPVCMATEDFVRQFQGIIEIYFVKIRSNLKQIQTLTELRDTLLPPLISGKIRV